jgi:hypothetical protein
MSTKATEYAWTIPVSSTPAKLVLLCIADEIRDQTCEAFPGRELIARKTGIGLRQVSNALDRLVRDGLIARSRRTRPNGSRTSDSYEIAGYAEWLAKRPAGKQPDDQTPPNPKCEKPHQGRPPLVLVPSDNLGAEKGKTLLRESAIPEPLEEPIPYGAGNADPSPSKVFWDSTLRLLSKATGKPPDKHRSYVGRLIKQSRGNIADLQSIVDAAERAETGDPVSYITKAVNEKFGAPPDPAKFDAARWRAIATTVLSRGNWADEWGKPPGARGCLMPAEFQTAELLERLNASRKAS